MTTTELRLLAQVDGLTQDFFSLTRSAEDRRVLETSSAVRIQSSWRGFVVRRNLAHMHYCAAEGQRFYRGHLGRVRAREQEKAVMARQRAAFFGAAATEVQRAYRGYRSRKYVHSFHARKAYLAAVAAKADELGETMREQYLEQVAALEAELEEAAHSQFDATVRGLHHLVSTESCPGIYNSPFAAITGGMPSVAGQPLEDHLRSARKGISLLPKAGAGSKPSTAEGMSRVSVQASSPFSALEDQRRDENMSSKYKLVSDRPFLAGGRAPEDRFVQTVRASTPFEANVREEKAKLKEAEKARKLISQKPFYLSVHPAELFEDTEAP